MKKTEERPPVLIAGGNETTYLSAEKRSKLHTLADRKGISRSSIMQLALDDYLKIHLADFGKEG